MSSTPSLSLSSLLGSLSFSLTPHIQSSEFQMHVVTTEDAGLMYLFQFGIRFYAYYSASLKVRYNLFCMESAVKSSTN